MSAVSNCHEFALERIKCRAFIDQLKDCRLVNENRQQAICSGKKLCSNLHIKVTCLVLQMPNMAAAYRRYLSGLKKADCLLVAKTRNPDFVRLIVEPPVPRRRPDLTAFIHKPLEVSSLQYLPVGPCWDSCSCVLALQNCTVRPKVWLPFRVLLRTAAAVCLESVSWWVSSVGTVCFVKRA